VEPIRHNNVKPSDETCNKTASSSSTVETVQSALYGAKCVFSEQPLDLIRQSLIFLSAPGAINFSVTCRQSACDAPLAFCQKIAERDVGIKANSAASPLATPTEKFGLQRAEGVLVIVNAQCTVVREKHAVATAERAVAVNPQDKVVKAKLAIAKATLKQAQARKKHFVVKIDVNSAFRAVADAERVIAYNPQNQAARVELERAQAVLNVLKKKLAVPDAERAVADAERAVADADRAVAVAERAVADNPQSQAARSELEKRTKQLDEERAVRVVDNAKLMVAVKQFEVADNPQDLTARAELEQAMASLEEAQDAW